MADAEDPVADFLAREQNDLAGLEDTLAGTTINGDAIQANAFGDFEDQAATEPPSEEQQQMNIENDLAAALGENPEDPAQLAVSAPPASMYDTQLTRPPEEPEKIRKWREEQKVRLDQKDKDEAVKIEEWKKQAKKELEDWYKNRSEQLANTKKNNRTAEEQFIEERDQAMPGRDWERIAKLCDFNPKNSKNTKDVARMRSLLLQMKGADASA